jgi:predicted NUDIX family NTP pyrophosphohydrolase
VAPALSAGLLVYRRRAGTLEVLLVHPGGPFFRRRDRGAWTVPKGLVEEGEDAAVTALRELEEETGLRLPGPGVELGQVRQKGGKVVRVWAVEHDPGPELVIRSNTFVLEWPPRSGNKVEFPEIDRGAFFPLSEARGKINPAQVQLLDRLAALVKE